MLVKVSEMTNERMHSSQRRHHHYESLKIIAYIIGNAFVLQLVKDAHYFLFYFNQQKQYTSKVTANDTANSYNPSLAMIHL